MFLFLRKNFTRLFRMQRNFSASELMSLFFLTELVYVNILFLTFCSLWTRECGEVLAQNAEKYHTKA